METGNGTGRGEQVTEDRNTQKAFGERVAGWFRDRGLIENSTPAKQMRKLLEEVGELSGAIANNDADEFKDAVGDVCVVLAGMCAQRGVSFEECLEVAWGEIKDRKGHMGPDGVFVKEAEVSE